MMTFSFILLVVMAAAAVLLVVSLVRSRAPSPEEAENIHEHEVGAHRSQEATDLKHDTQIGAGRTV